VYAFLAWLTTLFLPFEIIFKLLGWFTSPIINIIQFRRAKQDRRLLEERAELLVSKAEELGRLKTENANAMVVLDQKDKALKTVAAELNSKEARIAHQDEQIRKLSEGSADLWRLRTAKPFPQYREWMRAPTGARILSVGNNKGGVGKTTLTANLAAYISEKLKKNVLVVDLDHQGSVSSMMLLAADIPDVESRTERLFGPLASLATLSSNRIHLAGKLNRGWIIPANYTFASRENQLLFKYVVDEDTDVDMRFRLARTLLHPDVRSDYAAIIFDLPPRLSLGSVNALFASHHFLVPTILDKLSAEAVGRFIRQVGDIKKEFALDLDLAGVVATMTRNAALTQAEAEIWSDVCAQASTWKAGVDYDLGAIARRADIGHATGDDIAYLLPNQAGDNLRQIFDPVFAKICERIEL
jgi:cellulose biosynthesis protein BcsQ